MTASSIIPAAAGGGSDVDDGCHGHHYRPGLHRSAVPCRGTRSQRVAP